MKPLFDSNILIDYLNGIEAARAELNRYQDSAISNITFIEVLVGAKYDDEHDEHGKDDEHDEESQVRAFLQRFERIPLTEAIAERAIVLRRQQRLRLPDALIWATAQVENRLFVTRNTRDFPAAAPGIRVPYVI